jgi:hypothetical protein
MQLPENTPRATRTIAGIEVSVPVPFAVGQPLTEATAAMLNQTFAENISNNLRKTLNDGFLPEGAAEGTDPTAYTSETAQPLIDKYVTEYEPGVRRGGSGEARVTDPVEREARKIARQKAVEVVKAQGGKPADFDMGELTNRIFDANKELLMAAGKKVVAELEKAKAKGNDISVDGLLDGLGKAPAATEATA